jgi:o-succinylbenzoate synthase
MYSAKVYQHDFIFNTPGGTSRGVLTTRPGWIVEVFETACPHVRGLGECCIIPKLSLDDCPELPMKIEEVSQCINDYANNYNESLVEWPSLRFALETAFLDLAMKGQRLLFPSAFTQGTEGIAINGLIWMGQPEYMRQQIERKIRDGFNCLKMKIGAIDFVQELAILKEIRNRFPVDQLELRVDANGAFTIEDVWDKLDVLHRLNIHSIEQPIRQGQWHQMAEVCKNSPVSIALDEELIGITSPVVMRQLLETICPQYIILKPGLLGGFSVCRQWISLADELGIGWWITSALEGNIGLNAIAQWTYTLNSAMPQGLGTGQVFSNNFPSPLTIRQGKLYHQNDMQWDLTKLNL